MPDLHEEQTYEREFVSPGGDAIWVNISVADFPDPFDDEWLRSISVRDLTEVAHARRQLEQLVVSKDRFIASVSHELRTPLTVVVGLAAELADRPERLSIEEVREFASLICSQANDVTAIVEDLLTMARAQAGALTVNCQRIDLEAVVGEVVSSLPSDAVKRVSWTPRNPEWVWVDPIRLRQIIRNLVTNAERHGGNVIKVEIRRGALLVKDDGPPLPLEDRERIFEAYEQIGRPTSRTDSVGLGLAVCRLLSRLMNGDVAYSHDGSHSIFTLTLPIRSRGGRRQRGRRSWSSPSRIRSSPNSNSVWSSHQPNVESGSLWAISDIIPMRFGSRPAISSKSAPDVSSAPASALSGLKSSWLKPRARLPRACMA
jgi:signal transduction histidine kinase